MKEIKTIKILDNYKLLIQFDNEEKRIYDMSNRLNGVFAHLKDYEKFKLVKIVDGIPTWPSNEALPTGFYIDICPDAIYLNSLPTLDDYE